MSITLLLIFVLMLAELFSIALLSINYNTIDQAAAISTSSSNIGRVLGIGAQEFANQSARRALSTLINYEYTANSRRDNFITNFSAYMSSLIINGTIPKSAGAGGNGVINAVNLILNSSTFTFNSYNRSLLGSFNKTVRIVIINETQLVVSQKNPYTISVSYMENVGVNASGSLYIYNIPVNATVPLNGSADLFYAQQGILRPVRFGNINNLTSLIGGTYALSGNIMNFSYGTVLNLGVAPASCPVAAGRQFVLVANDLSGISGAGGCANNYGGLITYRVAATLPKVPYLVYSVTSNIVTSLRNGTAVLVYGPQLAVYNIENLKNAITNGYFFASPFAPSYSDRASANLFSQSPSGIFTFSVYNRQAASFNGVGSYVVNSVNLGAFAFPISAFAWIFLKKYTSNPGIGNAEMMMQFDSAAFGNDGSYQIGMNNVGTVVVAYGIPGSTSYIATTLKVPLNQWSFLGFVANSKNITVYNGTTSWSTGISFTPSSTNNAFDLGWNGNSKHGAFNGLMANVQLYNATLTNQQIFGLQQEGIEGLPVNNKQLAAWWPLNINTNDYSGNAKNGTSNTLNYTTLQNYTRDSIFMHVVPTGTVPVPGIPGCDNRLQCSNSSLAQLYLGKMPLELTNNIQTAGFLGLTNGGGVLSQRGYGAQSALTITGWLYATGAACSSQFPIDSNPEGRWRIGFDATCHIIFDPGSASDQTSTSTISFNKWYFVAVTAQNSGANTNYNIYVNGIPAGSGTVAGSNIQSVSNIALGDYSFPFSGSLANVQAYNTTLSASQVSALYQQGITSSPASNANAIGWWPLNGNGNDYSGNNNNGTVTNTIYPFISNYTFNGLSTQSIGNEWQAIGLGAPFR